MTRQRISHLCKAIARTSALVLLSLSFTICALEVAFELFPGMLPESHRYKARAAYMRNASALLRFLHRDEVQHNAQLFEFHPRYGWRGRPNIHGQNWEPDGAFEFQTNSFGFRDREHARENPQQSVRIAVLGNSFVWGLTLNQSELVPQLLERDLLKRHINAEVFNFGVAGYGTDQELLVLEDMVLQYRPRLVMLSFFYSNDFDDNSGERTAGGKAKPAFRLNASGELELVNVPVPRAAAARESSKTSAMPARLLAGLKDFGSTTFLYHLAVDVLRDIPVVERLLIKTGISTKSSSDLDRQRAEATARTRAVTKALIRRIKQKVEESGARFAVYIYPGYGYYDGQEYRYEEAVAFLRDVVDDQDLFQLAPAFDRQPGPFYGAYADHWTGDGARLAAGELTNHLIERYPDLFEPTGPARTIH